MLEPSMETKNSGITVKYHRTYRTWCAMKGRCHQPNNSDYWRYGARGITVCDEWRNSFAVFLRDMGDRESGNLSIDRIDNDKGYFPENCRWVTQSVQTRNTRRNNKITFRGETKCLTDWAIVVGICETALRNRIKRHGVERALTTPVAKQGEHRFGTRMNPDSVRAVRVMRQSGKSIAKIAKELNVGHTTIQAIVDGRTWKHVK